MRAPRHRFRRVAFVGLAYSVTALVSGCPFVLLQTVVLDAGASGSTVSLNVGARLIVRLGSNASTGYEWEVTELDTTVMENTGRSFVRACIIPMPGCGGTDAWEFTAVSAGTTDLRMIYHRPWEDVEPARVFELTVTVTPPGWR